MSSAATGGLPTVLPQARRERRTDRFRPLATFVAHLIATAQGAPQTRTRRRTGPDHATAVYAAAGRAHPRADIERLL
jgi:hypothetical protein